MPRSSKHCLPFTFTSARKSLIEKVYIHGIKGTHLNISFFSFQDRHAKGNVKPEVDSEQNWKLLYAEEDATSTTLVFTRPLRSCDTQNDLNIQVGSYFKGRKKSCYQH